VQKASARPEALSIDWWDEPESRICSTPCLVVSASASDVPRGTITRQRQQSLTGIATSCIGRAMQEFDVIVVGGGHAGCEAAAVAARMGAQVALVSFDPATIGAMSCNPAIGGLGKGHLVREVDAFDGLIARAADSAAIHYRMLNQSKGSAVRGPRIQADRKRFRAAIQSMLSAQSGLTVIAGEAAGLRMASGRVTGLDLADGRHIAASAVILCTGTFLGGRLFRGEERMVGGRIGEASAMRLAEQLREALPMARLKTGTPPRSMGRRSIGHGFPNSPATPILGQCRHWVLVGYCRNCTAQSRGPMWRHTI
jgi:tRNA uridine 5-carboxymethylaminomethyl modification enzyme